ncbi:MAG: hypothetical protein KF760_17870 [Candidatus Eremiobacteraeota bacterium]|nr:hypothetical protein [Candidatus Eremiobacteraeota bacterium]MCW5869249.1 hypothetical protein [Candidatus Eremiobacteraeota bacterium]
MANEQPADAQSTFEDHERHGFQVHNEQEFIRFLNRTLRWFSNPPAPAEADPRFNLASIGDYGGNFGPDMEVKILFPVPVEGQCWVFKCETNLWKELTDRYLVWNPQLGYSPYRLKSDFPSIPYGEAGA